MLPYILVFVNVALLLTGQTLWKTELSSIGQWDASVIFSLLKSPYIIFGLFLFLVATFIWFYILSRLPFGVAYPLQSISYVLSLFISFFIFKEPVTLHQWLGALAIVCGIFLIVKQ
jgi:drug/metabolite transporter (DMT)-like permease